MEPVPSPMARPTGSGQTLEVHTYLIMCSQGTPAPGRGLKAAPCRRLLDMNPAYGSADGHSRVHITIRRQASWSIAADLIIIHRPKGLDTPKDIPVLAHVTNLHISDMRKRPPASITAPPSSFEV